MILGKPYLGSTEIEKIYLGSNVVYEVGSSYPLDTYTNASTAIAFRKLKTGAVNCCQIRRSSDNALAIVLLEDTGFISLSSSIVAGGTLGTWLGSDNGFIKTMYDQTGNGNDWVTFATSEEPIIATSGVLNVDTNGNVTASFDNLGNRINANYTNASTVSTVFSVFESSDTSFVLYRDSLSGGVRFIGVGTSGSSSTVIGSNAGNPSYYINGTDTSATTRDDIYTNHSTGVPVLSTITNIDKSIWNNFEFAGYVNLYFENKLSLIIVFDTDETTNQSAIETEINSIYSIY